MRVRPCLGVPSDAWEGLWCARGGAGKRLLRTAAVWRDPSTRESCSPAARPWPGGPPAGGCGGRAAAVCQRMWRSCLSCLPEDVPVAPLPRAGGSGGRAAPACRRMWWSSPSCMPEACQRVAGGRSEAQTPGQHGKPIRPRQGSHKPPKPQCPTLPARPGVARGRVSAWARNSCPLNARGRTFAPCRGRTRWRPNRGLAAVLRTAAAPTATGHSRPLRGRGCRQPSHADHGRAQPTGGAGRRIRGGVRHFRVNNLCCVVE